MLDAADQYLGPISGVSWIRPNGGLYVWVRLPDGIDAGPSGRLFDLAVDTGVLYVPGQYCFPVEGPRHANTLRLSFGVPPVENIRIGVRLLSDALGSLRIQ
jgi:2-aminoadipate transaminase